MTVKEVIDLRHSVRIYRSECPSTNLLTEVLEAGRLAPTAVNKQPFRLVCITSNPMLDQIKAAYNRDWMKSAPAVIVVIAKHNESWHRKDGKDHADIDAAIVADHIILRATELGLGTCWVCNFDLDLAKQVLATSPDEEPVVLIPIGYETPNPDPKPRIRKDPNDIWQII